MPIIHQNFQISTPFLRGYKQLRIPIMDADGNPKWPQLFPVEKIDELRDMVGARHFSAQMMLEYIGDNSVRLDPNAFGFYDFGFDLNTAKLGDNLITGAAMYWDPSGGRIKSDNSVCVLIYRDDKNRRAFIHDIKYLEISDDDIHPLATQCDMVLMFMENHNMKKIAIEVNGIGNALPEILRESANKKGQPVIVQKIINHQKKEIRILDAIEPLLTTGRLWAHVRIRDSPVLNEMLNWTPLATNQSDDGLDAISGALRIQAAPVRTLLDSGRTLYARTDFKI